MEMFNIEVLLAITCPNVGKGGPKFALMATGDTLSLARVGLTEQESSLEVAAKILLETTGLQALIQGNGWVSLVPGLLADAASRKESGRRVIGVPYGCMLPEEVKLKGGLKWYSQNHVFDEAVFFHDHFDILQSVCGKL